MLFMKRDALRVINEFYHQTKKLFNKVPSGFLIQIKGDLDCFKNTSASTLNDSKPSQLTA